MTIVNIYGLVIRFTGLLSNFLLLFLINRLYTNNDAGSLLFFLSVSQVSALIIFGSLGDIVISNVSSNGKNFILFQKGFFILLKRYIIFLMVFFIYNYFANTKNLYILIFTFEILLILYIGSFFRAFGMNLLSDFMDVSKNILIFLIFLANIFIHYSVTYIYIYFVIYIAIFLVLFFYFFLYPQFIKSYSKNNFDFGQSSNFFKLNTISNFMNLNISLYLANYFFENFRIFQTIVYLLTPTNVIYSMFFNHNKKFLIYNLSKNNFLNYDNNAKRFLLQWLKIFLPYSIVIFLFLPTIFNLNHILFIKDYYFIFIFMLVGSVINSKYEISFLKLKFINNHNFLFFILLLYFPLFYFGVYFFNSTFLFIFGFHLLLLSLIRLILIYGCKNV